MVVCAYSLILSHNKGEVNTQCATSPTVTCLSASLSLALLLLAPVSSPPCQWPFQGFGTEALRSRASSSNDRPSLSARSILSTFARR